MSIDSINNVDALDSAGLDQRLLIHNDPGVRSLLGRAAAAFFGGWSEGVRRSEFALRVEDDETMSLLGKHELTDGRSFNSNHTVETVYDGDIEFDGIVGELDENYDFGDTYQVLESKTEGLGNFEVRSDDDMNALADLISTDVDLSVPVDGVESALHY